MSHPIMDSTRFHFQPYRQPLSRIATESTNFSVPLSSFPNFFTLLVLCRLFTCQLGSLICHSSDWSSNMTGHRLLCQVLMFFLCANLEVGDQISLQSLILKRILMSWFVHLFLISKKLFFILTTIWLYLIVNCLLHLIVLIIFHNSIVTVPLKSIIHSACLLIILTKMIFL